MGILIAVFDITNSLCENCVIYTIVFVTIVWVHILVDYDLRKPTEFYFCLPEFPQVQVHLSDCLTNFLGLYFSTVERLDFKFKTASPQVFEELESTVLVS